MPAETPTLFPLGPEPRRRRAGRRREGGARPAPELVPALYAHVALNRPMRCEYTYAVPVALAERLVPGVRVAVPLGGRREVGVVVKVDAETDLGPDKLRPVSDVLDPEPVVDGALLRLTRWIAGHYACSWGEALAAVLPAALKREGGRRTVATVLPRAGVGAAELAELEARHPKQHRVLRTLLDAGGPMEKRDLLRRLNLSSSPLDSLVRRGLVVVRHVESAVDALLCGGGVDRPRPERLTAAQAEAVDAITARMETEVPGAVLLWGVTGSGKTEVYLRVIEEALARGRGAIVLVPEIALTPQTVGWFRSRFEGVAVLHSRMTDVQRLDMWRRVAHGESRVVVGARSAVFAPVRELGVIVVDEEHEPSFKQANSPRYHARDVAVVRAREAGAVCVLGSATPSLESWHAAAQGRYARIDLPARVHGGAPPAIQVVDMRAELAETKKPALFSRALHGQLADALGRGEQAILFLNRRGYAPVLWCRGCGETVQCAHCAVPMTLHKRIGRLVCHTCCQELSPPEECPSCTAPGLRFLGVGSERVEDVLRAVFPTARVGRMDSDTMLRREDYERTLAAFGRGELDVLVGTQMIAKGLDFPRVTVVGIVSADSTLHLPDFRAAERTFQLISQVSGRAGRAELEGRIVIQTIVPEHPAIVQAARHDFPTFAELEMRFRDELGYPPHGRLVRVVFEDEDEERAREAADRFAAALDALEPAGEPIDVLGPTPAPLAMVRGRHRMHLLVKGREGVARARDLLARLAAETPRPRVAVDVDPVGML